MRLVTPALLLLLLLLQFRIWFGEHGVADYFELKQLITVQAATNQQLMRQNQLLEEEIIDLKSGQDALEERARNELGMIQKGEVFFRLPQNAETSVHD